MQTSSHAISYLYDERAGHATLFPSRLVDDLRRRDEGRPHVGQRQYNRNILVLVAHLS
jgi:hypothetical protein